MYTMATIRVQPCAKVAYLFDIHNILKRKSENYYEIVVKTGLFLWYFGYWNGGKIRIECKKRSKRVVYPLRIPCASLAYPLLIPC